MSSLAFHLSSRVRLLTELGTWAPRRTIGIFVPGPILYSANPWIKHYLYERYRGGQHYVWCSESYDSGARDPMSVDSMVPPSSNPMDIIHETRAAIVQDDHHNHRIAGWTNGITMRAAEWHRKSEVDAAALGEIVALAKRRTARVWWPLLYVIPRAAITGPRLQAVPPEERAGAGVEYIIKDLRREEFDAIAVYPWP